MFGDRETGAYLLKSSWTPCLLSGMFWSKGGRLRTTRPWPVYWAKRRRRAAPPALGRHAPSLPRLQRGRCPLCRVLLLHADHEPQNPRNGNDGSR